MTIPRRQQVSLEHTTCYHCISRCVRRAFLCGRDRCTGKNFSHRRNWLETRLQQVAEVFAIDLLAYAIMSNHYHVVLRVNVSQAERWSDDEVRERWARLFKVPDDAGAESPLAEWRRRLHSISWFMRCLNEPLARRANREDGCRGRFWEGRFKLQALLDDAALLRCMAYVDLNPVRAGVVSAPEHAAHTSFHARLNHRDKHLLPLNGAGPGAAVPVTREEYIKLVDISGRSICGKKRGRIPESLDPILQRLGIDPSHWAGDMRHYGRWYYRAVGSVHALERYRRHLGQRWLKGAQPRLGKRAIIQPA